MMCKSENITLPYLSLCGKCNYAVFECCFVDFIIRFDDEGESAYFMVLYEGILPPLTIGKSEICLDEKAFANNCVMSIRCQKCKYQLGYKIISGNKIMFACNIVRRIVIKIDRVIIQKLKTHCAFS